MDRPAKLRPLRCLLTAPPIAWNDNAWIPTFTYCMGADFPSSDHGSQQEIFRCKTDLVKVIAHVPYTFRPSSNVPVYTEDIDHIDIVERTLLNPYVASIGIFVPRLGLGPPHPRNICIMPLGHLQNYMARLIARQATCFAARDPQDLSLSKQLDVGEQFHYSVSVRMPRPDTQDQQKLCDTVLAALASLNGMGNTWSIDGLESEKGRYGYAWDSSSPRLENGTALTASRLLDYLCDWTESVARRSLKVQLQPFSYLPQAFLEIAHAGQGFLKLVWACSLQESLPFPVLTHIRLFVFFVTLTAMEMTWTFPYVRRGKRFVSGSPARCGHIICLCTVLEQLGITWSRFVNLSCPPKHLKMDRVTWNCARHLLLLTHLRHSIDDVPVCVGQRQMQSYCHALQDISEGIREHARRGLVEADIGTVQQILAEWSPKQIGCFVMTLEEHALYESAGQVIQARSSLAQEAPSRPINIWWLSGGEGRSGVIEARQPGLRLGEPDF